MKSAIICALTFIFLVNGLSGVRSIENLPVCKPGTTRVEDCNTCFCVGTGSGWACTKRGCYADVAKIPEDSITQSNGDNPANRIKREEIQARPNTETQVQPCVLGTTKMEDCNSCFCTEVGWACTRKGCYVPISLAENPGDTMIQSHGDSPSSRVKRGEIQAQPNTGTQVQPCVLGTTKMEDCNSCFCTVAGWTCTEKGCYVPISGAENPGDTMIQSHGDNLSSRLKRGEIQAQPNTEVQVQPCVLGTTKMEDCNDCFCTEAGWACTEKGCYVPISGAKNSGDTMIQSDGDNPSSRVKREEVQAEPNTKTREQTCVVGSTKRVDCNSCFCSETGWACTIKGCLPSGFIVPYDTQPDKAAH